MIPWKLFIKDPIIGAVRNVSNVRVGVREYIVCENLGKLLYLNMISFMVNLLGDTYQAVSS